MAKLFTENKSQLVQSDNIGFEELREVTFEAYLKIKQKQYNNKYMLAY